ncbi:hypothetical protein MRS76_11175 [Rhizobiaceae bacterium n13]|uniref:glycoside hydrolase family 19 protein n=1 Tax=Ferirhizobium litorale TaxID=2927786 RepID=UPI0024B30E4F|nr:glycoside hydrolase family 19 protein [Fererhizobium litorale]MDI7862522.1 hypothetical protein [Fererhizobium litorale]
MIDMETFFAYARRAPFGGALKQVQINGVNAILAAAAAAGVIDLRLIAYMLATAFHETGGTMAPVRETFAKSDAQAVASLEKAWRDGKLGWVTKPYWRPDKSGRSWFGRGLVQLTHLVNYEKMSKLVGIDLVRDPATAMGLQTSAAILVIGMMRGTFTGKKLSDYFNVSVNNAEGARAVVNGKDKAKLIAGYYIAFLDSLTAASKVEQPIDVHPEAAKPDDIPVAESKSLWTILLTAFPGLGGLAFLGQIDNAFALGAFALVLVAVGVGAWLVLSGRVTIKRGKAMA